MKDKRIDSYIEKSKPFAKPILKHLRKIVHKAVPDVQETIKWGFPHFEVNNSILCSTASFKEHCAIVIPKASLLKDNHKVFSNVREKAMGQFGKITNMGDLPPDNVLIDYIKDAAELCREGIKVKAKAKTTEKKELVIPDYFIKAIRKNKKAFTIFEGFSYSHKKEYVEWITDARRDETREKRIAQAIEMMGEGKDLNWKYKK